MPAHVVAPERGRRGQQIPWHDPQFDFLSSVMASGQDPLADMQNLIGYQGLVGDNPFISIQPGQRLQPVPAPPAGHGDGLRPDGGGYPGDADARTAIRSEALLRKTHTGALAAVCAWHDAQHGMPAGGPSGTFNYAAMGSAGAPLQELMNNYQAAQAKLSPQQQYNQQQTRQMDFRQCAEYSQLEYEQGPQAEASGLAT